VAHNAVKVQYILATSSFVFPSPELRQWKYQPCWTYYYNRADELMERMPKMARGKVSLPSGIHCLPNFCIYFAWPVAPYCDWYVYTYTCLCRNCVWITVATICEWNILQTSGVMRSVDWVFTIWAPAWRWLGDYVTLDKTFYSFIFKQKAVTPPVTRTFSSLSHYPRGPLLEM